jgi:hypothetical protein
MPLAKAEINPETAGEAGSNVRKNPESGVAVRPV